MTAKKVAKPKLSVQKAQERGEQVATNEILLEITGLTKTYGATVAAADITLQIRAGSFTGVVGPNGAGKTTLLTMLSGLNKPTAGKIMLLGQELWGKDPLLKRNIGVLPDKLRLFDRLTGAQLLQYAGVLYDMPQEVITKRVQELAKAFAIDNALNRVVADYSVGMQKKIMLACALLHAPKLLILDEPFESIDPVSATTVTEILEQFVAAGGSVLVSSHSLELIERVCDHVVVLNAGKVVASGAVAEVAAGSSLVQKFQSLMAADAEDGVKWLPNP